MYVKLYDATGIMDLKSNLLKTKIAMFDKENGSEVRTSEGDRKTLYGHCIKQEVCKDKHGKILMSTRTGGFFFLSHAFNFFVLLCFNFFRLIVFTPFSHFILKV